MHQSLTWEEVSNDSIQLAKLIGPRDVIVSAGRGGLVPSTIISHVLDIPVYNFGIKSYNKNNQQGELTYDQTLGIKFVSKYRDSRVVIIDDLSDKGTTLIAIKEFFDLQEFSNYKIATLYIKKSTSYIPNFYIKIFDDTIWLDFPWETAKLD